MACLNLSMTNNGTPKFRHYNYFDPMACLNLSMTNNGTPKFRHYNYFDPMACLNLSMTNNGTPKFRHDTTMHSHFHEAIVVLTYVNLYLVLSCSCTHCFPLLSPLLSRSSPEHRSREKALLYHHTRVTNLSQ